jgi:hypothetical protein
MKEHHRYRHRFFEEVNEGIRQTDYRITCTNMSDAHPYLMHTGPHRAECITISLAKEQIEQVAAATPTKAARSHQHWHRSPYAGSRPDHIPSVDRCAPSSSPRSEPIDPQRSFQEEEATEELVALPTDAPPLPFDAEQEEGAVVPDSGDPPVDEPTPPFPAAPFSEEEEEEEAPTVPSEADSLGFSISVPELLSKTAAQSVGDVPSAYYIDLRDQGFGWLYLTEFPAGDDRETVNQTVTAIGLKLSLSFPDDATDSALLDLLIESRADEFERCLAGLSEIGLVHYPGIYPQSKWPMATALLLLPGLRILNEGLPCYAQLRKMLTSSTLISGELSIPHVVRHAGKIVAWKYSGKSRFLICVNFSEGLSSASIECPDAPDPTDGQTIVVYEWLMETTFRRNPAVLRTEGLHVILHDQFEIQAFEY